MKPHIVKITYPTTTAYVSGTHPEILLSEQLSMAELLMDDTIFNRVKEVVADNIVVEQVAYADIDG